MPVLLLVDDDIEVLALNKQYLEKEGFTTNATDSPLKALSLLKNIATRLYDTGHHAS